MAIWQWGLLALFGVWALQSLGVWLQMRHYTDVFKGVTNQFNDGFVGAGNYRGRFSKGTIVVVVVTPGPDRAPPADHERPHGLHQVPQTSKSSRG